MNSTVFLASKSPQRRKLLEQIGIRYKILDVNVNENNLGKETPQQYVTRLAMNKAKAGWDYLQQENVKQKTKIPVIGADTCISIDGLILGKPRDGEQGHSMLKMLSAKTHQVFSAVSIIGFAQRKDETESRSNTQNALVDPLLQTLLQEWRVNESQVTFRKLSDQEIEAYWNTGEPKQKAGGYAVQGLAAQFISHLSGSYSAVMGLPLFELAELLSIFGISTEVGDE